MPSEDTVGLSVWSSKGTSLEMKAVSCPLFTLPTLPAKGCGILGEGSLAVLWWNSAESSFRALPASL